MNVKRNRFLPTAFLTLILSIVLLALILNITNPSDIGAIGILFVLVLVYALFFSLFIIASHIVWVIVDFLRAGKKNSVVNKARTMRRQKLSNYISAILAFAPLFIISLNSLGQIRIWDVLLIVLFEALAIFYVHKRI